MTHQLGTERNDDFYLFSFSAFSNLLWLEMKLLWYYFNLLNCFFAIFLEFSLTCQAGMKRSNNFYFLSSSAFSNQFWLEITPWWYFLIFWIFSLFFWNFLLHIGSERNRTIIFIFSLSRTFPTYFGLKWSHNGIFLFFFLFFWNFIFPVG